MGALDATSFDVANVVTNIALGGAALLTVGIASMGWRKIITFFR